MRYTKGVFKFSKRELWNLDNTLGKIISDGLEQFKTQGLHSYPMDFSISDDSSVGDQVDKATADWLACIDKMIYAFKTDTPDMPDNCIRLEGVDKLDCAGVFKSRIVDQEAYDNYQTAVKDHKIKVEQGLALFAKYFNHLWD